MKLLLISVDRHSNRVESTYFMSVSQLWKPLLPMPGVVADCDSLSVRILGQLFLVARTPQPLCMTDGANACVQAATADKTAKQRLSQLDAQLNELKKEQAELTKQWEREKVCLSCLRHHQIVSGVL